MLCYIPPQPVKGPYMEAMALQKRLTVLLIALFVMVSQSNLARAEGKWGFGSDLGLTTGTVNNTVFTLGFNLDYYVDRNFSFGPMMLLTPSGDLFQVAFAGVGKYHVRLKNGVNIVPFTGIGLIHANLDRGAGPARIDRNDTSWYIPIGVSLEYQVVHNIALSSTLLVNLHDINLSPSLPEKDSTSVSLLFGIRWGP
jgi:hypothetical protein